MKQIANPAAVGVTNEENQRKMNQGRSKRERENDRKREIEV